MFSYRLYRFVSWIRYTVPRRFTLAGLLALIALAASGAVGADMDQTVAFQIFAFLLSLLLVSMLAAPFFRGRFVARRILPRFGSVGQPLAYHVVVRNATRRTQRTLEVIDELVDPRPTRAEFTRARRRLVLEGFRKLRLAAPVPLQPIASGVKPVALPNLREHAEATVRSEMIPLRRGALRFAAVIIARPDPLGLFRGFIRTPLPQSVLILPKRYPLPNFTLPGSRTYQRGGVALASAIGESDEFVALRDYRPGDPLRHIHWRSWARHGRPVVKEFQDEFFVRHALILDTFANNEQRAVFEEAVAVAASFACTVGTQETLLDLLFVGPQAVCVTTGRGLGQAEQALEALAAVQPGTAQPFSTLEELVMRYAGAVCGCVCVFLSWDEARRELVRKLERRGLPVVVLRITGPSTSKREASIPGAERSEHFFILEAGQIAEGLQRLGKELA